VDEKANEEADGDTAASSGSDQVALSIEEPRSSNPKPGRGEGYRLVVKVLENGAQRELEVASDFQHCEQTHTALDRVFRDEQRRDPDPRLFMVQLACESGEDIFQRRLITALLFVGDRSSPSPSPSSSSPARILWHGESSYENQFGSCETFNVLYFRSDNARAVVIRETGVTFTKQDVPVQCRPKPMVNREVLRVAIP